MRRCSEQQQGGEGDVHAMCVDEGDVATCFTPSAAQVKGRGCGDDACKVGKRCLAVSSCAT
jgi:hypothetical protein